MVISRDPMHLRAAASPPARAVLGERLLAPGLVMLLLASAAAADVRRGGALFKTAVVGGEGGAYFEALCPPDQHLDGLELRVGDDVDAVRPVCVLSYDSVQVSPPEMTSGTGLVPSGKTTIFGAFEQRVAPGWYGGPGGQLDTLLCPPRTPIVVGMNIEADGYDIVSVNAIELVCGLAATQQGQPDLAWVEFSGPLGSSIDGGRSGNTMRTMLGGDLNCPAGQVAVGIHGRAGVWLDAIGMVCAPPRLHPEARPVRPVARIKGERPPSTPIPICEAAQAAAARNSPAAPGLAARCRADPDAMTNDPTPDEAGLRPSPRVKPGGGRSGAPRPICESAAAARDRNSPAAEGLKAQCLAIGGQVPPPVGAKAPPDLDQLAAKGAGIANGNAWFAALKSKQTTVAMRRGFDIALGAAEGQTEWGPGKQALLDSLPPAEREGFRSAISLSLDFYRNVDRANAGLAISRRDGTVAAARQRETDSRYWLGFDIATGIFGDPALGAQGNTVAGPGSTQVRNSLGAVAQRGYDAGAAWHMSRTYRR